MEGEPPKTRLPQTLVIGGTSFVFDWLDKVYLEKAFQLFLEAQRTGDGYGQDEHTREKFMERVQKSVQTTCIIDCTTKELAAVTINEGSLLCRSTRPMLIGGATVVNKKYRGIGILREIHTLLFRMAPQLGFIGMCIYFFVFIYVIKVLESVLSCSVSRSKL